MDLGRLHLERLSRSHPKSTIFHVLGWGLKVFEKPGLSVGSSTWPGSHHAITVLAKEKQFVESHIKQCRVIELGAGCNGLLGMASAILGAREVVMSDLAEVMPLLSSTVAVNAPDGYMGDCHVSCKSLDWENAADEPQYDTIVACEVVYSESTLSAFVNALSLANHAYLFYKNRDDAVTRKLWDELEQNGWERRQIDEFISILSR